MKIEKLDEKENKMLGRKEVEANINYDGATPKREDIKKEICGKMGANPDMSVLREVNTQYGIRRINALLHIYNDVEKMKEVESDYLLKRDKLIKEEKKAGKTPKEEKPKEEPKKEEKPAEKKEEKKEATKEEKKGE